jgi:F0F1-type ATP synthase delta subunit
MRARHYAQAIKALLDSAPTDAKRDEIIAHAAKTIVENGHHAFVPRILRRLGAMLESDKRDRTITVTSAHPIPENEVAALLKTAPYNALLSGTHRYVKRKTDPTLIGGAVVRTRGMRVDASEKRALLDLYHHLTQ